MFGKKEVELQRKYAFVTACALVGEIDPRSTCQNFRSTCFKGAPKTG